jgi:hypothetical protein
MDEEIVKQMLDELFSSFADSETRSAGLLLFLKDQGIASDEKLAPYFEQAANTSEVRWRAARVRMGALLASALKTPEPAVEKKTPGVQEKQSESTTDVDAKKADARKADARKTDTKKADTRKANGQTPAPKSEGFKNEAAGAPSPEDAVESTQKSQGKNRERTPTDRESAQ